jgi:hypothetical protein
MQPVQPELFEFDALIVRQKTQTANMIACESVQSKMSQKEGWSGESV